MDKFTILDVNEENGEVTVQFSFAPDPVVYGGFPLNDKKTLIQLISNQGDNLKSQLAKQEISAEVTDLIGKPQDIPLKVAEADVIATDNL